MRKETVSLITAGIIAVSFIWLGNIVSGTIISVKNKGYLIVKGFAHRPVKANFGRFYADIIEEDKDMQACYSNLDRKTKIVKKFLQHAGFNKQEVKFLSVKVNEKYKINERGYKTDEFLEYKMVQTFKIESRNVDKIARLNEKISGLLEKGIKIKTHSPEYICTNLDSLKVEMIGRAAANAKVRAEIIARKGRFRLGPIASVRVGVFQITPAASTDISDYGINDVTSINKEIKSVVEVKYFVR